MENQDLDDNKTELYVNYINSHILPFVDYNELLRSYMTDWAYAKGILNRLHIAMTEVFGSDRLDAEMSDDGIVVIPGVLRNRDTGIMCLTLLTIDLTSSGEHWGTSYLCKYGVVPQDGEFISLRGTLESATKEMNNSFIPYDYGYTAIIPCDIHVRKSTLPEEIQSVLSDFRNYSADLLYDEAADKQEIIGRVFFANGEQFSYIDADEYIKVIKEELPYRNTSGFRFETITDDPRVRKAVDDLICNEFGEDNPRNLEDYTIPRPHTDKEVEDWMECGDDD